VVNAHSAASPGSFNRRPRAGVRQPWRVGIEQGRLVQHPPRGNSRVRRRRSHGEHRGRLPHQLRARKRSAQGCFRRIGGQVAFVSQGPAHDSELTTRGNPTRGRITRQLRENAMHGEAEPPAAGESLDELLEQMTPENSHALALEGSAAGAEAW
jgi:hypothetical protein